MAVSFIDLRSDELKMNTTVTVCFPDPGRMNDTPISERQVLWLLHGLGDDSTAWLRYSQVDFYPMQKDMIVVMPSGNRSMYCDNVYGQNFFSYITRELPQYLHNVFGISMDREKNFIAGFSMGGMGAVKAALTYPENYKAVGSFCGVLDLAPLALVLNDEMKNDFAFLLTEIDNVENSKNNPSALLDPEKDKDLGIYVACGFQDDLLIPNYAFIEHAKELGVEVESVFEDGMHEWSFVNRHIKTFIEKYMG